MKRLIIVLALCWAFLTISCATSHKQHGSATKPNLNVSDSVKIVHKIYLAGDAGDADLQGETLSLLSKRLSTSDENATLLFLGDNIYPRGMPSSENDPERRGAENKLMAQLQLAKNFKGKTIFIPGNHDWYNGLKGLEAQEKFVNNYLGPERKSFLPRKGCVLDDITINDSLILIVIDSQWILEDWSNHATINDDCELKTKESFYEEFESLINKNQNKTTIVALHHPLISNGPHGGQFSFRQQLHPFKSQVPLPIVGSFLNLIRRTSGVSPQDLQNKVYLAFINRMKAILHSRRNVIVVSGHEHNLQYIDHDGVKQVISGSMTKKEGARAIYPNNFSVGENGYAVLDIKADRSVDVHFMFADENGKEESFTTTILGKSELRDPQEFARLSEKTVKASIYTKEMTRKSRFYKFLWGSHYREYYSMPIEATVVYLDTLFGGVKPTIIGGGHQSVSLRLESSDGKEYIMRALKKSPARLLQSVAFKDQNVQDQFENTSVETFIYDFYTTAHPFTPFIIGDLADRLSIFHSNPKLYYVPVQKTLGKFNDEFGNALYMIEERPTDEHKNMESFGKPDAIISTDDMLANIRKDEKYQIDEKAYLRARLFDMLIGDWDRHSDQWRWAEFNENESVVYRPVPRDHDQAFAKVDGNLLSLIMYVPGLRHIKSFEKHYSDVRWFNMSGYPLDIALLKKSVSTDWIEQARFIAENLSDDAIDSAFAKLPKEVQDKEMEDLKAKLKFRKGTLEQAALQYYNLLQKRVLVVGTNKADRFVITRMPEGHTKITVSRIKKIGDELQFSRVYDKSETKEIWIYGLDGKDVFEEDGTDNKPIRIRLMGGQNNDVYNNISGRKIKIYDYRSKENSFQATKRNAIRLSDEYEVNEYDYKKPKYNVFAVYPAIGYNPDAGVILGASLNFFKHGLIGSPYSQKHKLKGNYHFMTQGFEISYSGIFKNVVGKWDFEAEALYTTPNFSINYFGYGNETENKDSQYGTDFNRVRIQMLRVAPSLKRIGRFGGELQIRTFFENIEVEQTTGRFVNVSSQIDQHVFDYQQFAGVNLIYKFENYDRISNPKMGMGFSIEASWRANLSEMKRNFPYLESSLGLSHKLTPGGNLVFGTLLKGKAVLNNHFEFYHGATLGGDYDLRGFRNERFLGKSSFFQSSDLRCTLGKVRQSIIPMSFGVLGGYDYGRVWIDGENSKKWHQSVGGGLWLNGLNTLTARITYFNSTDGNRLAFGLGFGF